MKTTKPTYLELTKTRLGNVKENDMEWQRYGYECKEDNGQYFYQVLTKRPDGSLKHEPIDVPKQGPFNSEVEAMNHLQHWIDEQTELNGERLLSYGALGADVSFDDVEFDNRLDYAEGDEMTEHEPKDGGLGWNY